MAISNKWNNEFYSKAMRNLVSYLLTYNMETQVAAINSTAQDIQSTGTKQCSINGVNIPALAADSACDVSAEPAYKAWTSGDSYTTNGLLCEVVDAYDKHWVCIQAHTAAAANHPLSEAGPSYWKRLDKWAEQAVGNVVAQDKQAVYLICARTDGTLATFIAYTKGTEAATTAVVIPPYDPERYVAIGLLKVVPTSGSHTFGTTVLTSVGTFTQILGHCFPDADLLDKS